MTFLTIAGAALAGSALLLASLGRLVLWLHERDH